MGVSVCHKRSSGSFARGISFSAFGSPAVCFARSRNSFAVHHPLASHSKASSLRRQSLSPESAVSRVKVQCTLAMRDLSFVSLSWMTRFFSSSDSLSGSSSRYRCTELSILGSGDGQGLGDDRASPFDRHAGREFWPVKNARWVQSGRYGVGFDIPRWIERRRQWSGPKFPNAVSDHAKHQDSCGDRPPRRILVQLFEPGAMMRWRARVRKEGGRFNAVTGFVVENQRRGKVAARIEIWPQLERLAIFPRTERQRVRQAVGLDFGPTLQEFVFEARC